LCRIPRCMSYSCFYSSLSSVPFLPLSFFFNPPSTTHIYTLSLHDALPICSPLPSRSSRHAQREELAERFTPPGPSQSLRLPNSSWKDRETARAVHDLRLGLSSPPATSGGSA